MTNTKILPSGQLLDTLQSTQPLDQYQYELREIFAALGLAPTMRNFEVVARDLSRLARIDPPWTKKYIHSVYKGRIEVSPALAKAINDLAQRVDGTPSGVAGSVYVRVLAQPEIPEGVLLPAKAKVVKCATPGCPVWFIKVHPRQIYHDTSCR